MVAARILDPATAELPKAGLLHLRDLETGRAQWVDTSHRGVRAAYRERVTRWQEELEERFAKSGVDVLELAPDRSVAEPIVKFFRMRELRGAKR